MRKKRKTLSDCIKNEILPEGFDYYRALPSEVKKLESEGWTVVKQMPDLRIIK